MMNYKDRRWIRKRERILKRDNYECRECRRYGKTTRATTVHHIKPVDEYPELWLDSRNLISLCTNCHNQMHDRVTDKLTSKGLGLLDRTYRDNPPTLGI